MGQPIPEGVDGSGDGQMEDNTPVLYSCLSFCCVGEYGCIHLMFVVYTPCALITASRDQKSREMEDRRAIDLSNFSKMHPREEYRLVYTNYNSLLYRCYNAITLYKLPIIGSLDVLRFLQNK